MVWFELKPTKSYSYSHHVFRRPTEHPQRQKKIQGHEIVKWMSDWLERPGLKNPLARNIHLSWGIRTYAE